MRITNKMMSNNSLVNINGNKEYLDKLNNQMATEKKLIRASDDPIVAIRALKLRGALSEVSTYYDANIPDAKAWVDVTQTAIESTVDMLSNMKALCDQGANGTNDASARAKIYEGLNADMKQIYSNGNTSYAGRTVFTGFRTDRSLTFAGDTEADYRGIKDTFNASDVKRAAYVEGALSMDDIEALNAPGHEETTVKENTVNRIRLSYDNLNSAIKTESGEETSTSIVYRKELDSTPVIEQSSVKTDPLKGLQEFSIRYGSETYKIKKQTDGTFDIDPADPAVTVEQRTDKSFTVSVEQTGAVPPVTGVKNVFNVSANGKLITSSYSESAIEVPIISSTEDAVAGKTAYQELALDPNNQNSDAAVADKIYLLKDTGELVFGSSIAKTLSSLKDIEGVDTIAVTYDKTSFRDGDPRPEHYFDCTLEDIQRPDSPIIFDNHRQAMEQTVTSDQTVKINTNAEDLFDTQIAREVKDILDAITDVNSAQEKVDRLKAMQENTSQYGKEDQEKIAVLLDAANKELDIVKNKLQSVYEKGITSFGQFHDQANLASTGCGAVDNRLELISNRLMEEKATVKTLASENEDVDITNIAVEVSEAELVYNAALLSTGKISQHTLMDYI